MLNFRPYFSLNVQESFFFFFFFLSFFEGGVARSLANEKFAFGELKMHFFSPFYSKFVTIYEFWGLHASLTKNILHFAT